MFCLRLSLLQRGDSKKAFAFVQSLAAEHGMLLAKTSSSENVLGVIQSLLDNVGEEKVGLESDLGDLTNAHGANVAAHQETIDTCIIAFLKESKRITFYLHIIFVCNVFV